MKNTPWHSLHSALAVAKDCDRHCPFAHRHRATGRRVSALQTGAKPPAAPPPRWALAARAAGLLEVRGNSVVLWTPTGPQRAEPGDWLLHVEGVLGLFLVPAPAFEQQFIPENDNASATQQAPHLQCA